MIHSGWIKLHRQLIDWEWYTDANTMRVFLHLLLTCNRVKKKWRGEIIGAGSKITSIENLANEVKLSSQQTRTALNKLKSTNNITIKTTNKFTLVTVVKWASYQDNDSQPTSNLTSNSTNEQQTNNNQITNKQQTNNNNLRSKEVKNIENDKNERIENKRVPRTPIGYNFETWPRSLTDIEIKSLKANRKGKQLTQAALDVAYREIQKAVAKGYTFDYCIDEWINRGWVGFKADWIKQDAKPKSNMDRLDEFEAVAEATRKMMAGKQ